MVWFKRFADPIILAGGRQLLTLRDAADYIVALPKAESDTAYWQIAMQTLIAVAERNGSEKLARIAMLWALNRGKPPPVPAPKKSAKKFRVVR
jgi:hypothetical protein